MPSAPCLPTAQPVHVHTCAELRRAMGDAAVRHVVMSPRLEDGGWNCTADEFPTGAVTIRGRDLLLEGQGPGLVRWVVSAAQAAGQLPERAGGGTGRQMQRGGGGRCGYRCRATAAARRPPHMRRATS